MTLSDRDRDWVGARFAKRYDVESRVGSGASATVYRAQDRDENRTVALKISRPFVLTKQRRAARFLREVQAVQRIVHPGCAQVLDWGIERDCAYIVMELIESDDLFELIKRDAPIDERTAVNIAAEICEVLAAAHAIGVVHRDLKPRNVMVLSDEDPVGVKVLDFGLAKLMRTPADEEGTLPLDLTKPGAVLGTPHYMAPEQVRDGGMVDGRADLYAVAVMLYEMVTARRPLEERNAVRALIAIGTQKPLPPSEHIGDIDAAVERVILRGLEKNPFDRFQSAEEMANVLRELGKRLAEDNAPTRAMKRKEAKTFVMVRESDSDAPEDEQLTRVHRPEKSVAEVLAAVVASERVAAAEDEDIQTRVYKPGERPPAPKMVAKPSVVGAESSAGEVPSHDPGREPEPDAEECHTEVMPISRDQLQRRLSARKRATRSETEKGIRAALVTITVAALTAALGRWLGLW